MDDTRDGSYQPQLRDLLGTVPAAVATHNPTSAGTHGTDGQKPAGLRYRRYAPSVGIAAPGKTRVSILQKIRQIGPQHAGRPNTRSQLVGSKVMVNGEKLEGSSSGALRTPGAFERRRYY